MQRLIVLLWFGLASTRLSDDKCKEYYEKPLPNGLSLIDEFPHMGLLGYKKGDNISHNCPAALISASYMITPAYCVTHRAGKPTHVILGTSDPKHNDKYKLLNVVGTVVHPDYNDRNRTYCIALVKFSPPITSNDQIRPGCLYTKPADANQNITETLWRWRPSQILFKIDSSIVSIPSCRQIYNGYPIDEQSHLCLRRNSLDEFHRDIGGAAHIYEDGIAKIVAIGNYGPSRPTSEIPEVTTNVYNHLDWIENNVWS